jgi:hypothetical protein
MGSMALGRYRYNYESFVIICSTRTSDYVPEIYVMADEQTSANLNRRLLAAQWNSNQKKVPSTI